MNPFDKEQDNVTDDQVKGYWPHGKKYTKFNRYYHYWMLPHSFFILFFYILRFAFENDKPK